MFRIRRAVSHWQLFSAFPTLPHEANRPRRHNVIKFTL